MSSKKGLVYYIAVLVIVILVFNMIAFVIPFRKTSTYWIGYGFTMAAIILAFATSFYAFQGNRKSRFYGFPLIMLAWMFLATQLLLGLVFMTVSMLPFPVPLIVSVVLLAAYLIGLFATDISKDYVENFDKEIKQQTFFMKSLLLDMEEISSNVSDAVLAEEIKKLIEDIHYCDPVSAEQLSVIENQIQETVRDLKTSIEDGKKEQALNLTGKIQSLLVQRNQKCKLLK